MAHIGKLVVSSKQLIAVIYEFGDGHVSITNIDPAGYQVLDALAGEESLGILELKTGRRIAFQIFKEIADLSQKRLVCTAKIWPDPYVGFVLREWETQRAAGQYEEGQ